jgi:hypothetical protein
MPRKPERLWDHRRENKNKRADISWSTKLETYFKEIGEKSICYAGLHRKCNKQFTRWKACIDIPTIVLSTISGSLALASKSLFGSEHTQTVTIGVGITGIAVAALSVVGNYFEWSNRAAQHRVSVSQYARLERTIRQELCLPRHERMAAVHMLEHINVALDQISEIAPPIPKKILKNSKSKYDTITLPDEISGGSKIVTYEQADWHAEQQRRKDLEAAFAQEAQEEYDVHDVVSA